MADIVYPEPEKNNQNNSVIIPVYADEIDPNNIQNAEDNILNNYKNKTLHIFTVILMFLIILASISIKNSIKGNNNDNSNY